MKPLKQKQEEAVQRLIKSTYNDSKAKRKGTKSEDEWNAWKQKHLDFLTGA